MMPSDLKARVLEAVAKEQAPTRAAVVRDRALAWVLAPWIPLAIFFAEGGLHAHVRPLGFVELTAAGWLASAVLVTAGVVRRGSMLGPSRAAIVAWTLAVPTALLGWYVASLSSWPIAYEPAPLARGVGCLLLTLAMAAVPFALFLRARRGSDPVHPAMTGAALGAAAGAWASVLIDLHCEQADVLHVAVGHVLPAVLLAILGAILGARLLASRA